MGDGGGWLWRRRAVISFLLVVAATIFVTEQIIYSGPLVDFDYYVHYLRLDQRYPSVYTPLFYLVMLGQRGPTAIPAFVIATFLAWRRRSWRPIFVLGLSLLTLNVTVGVMKLWTARLKPSDNSTAPFHHGGIIFPSGHASNVVVTWGIVAYLLVRYGPLKKRWPGGLLTLAATVIVGLCSIYLDTHWVTDIIAGWTIGLGIVQATIWMDRRTPDDIVRRAIGWVRPSGATATPPHTREPSTPLLAPTGRDAVDHREATARSSYARR